MSHPIPEPFVWDESFKVFYDKLDGEHQGLFQAIFDVGKTPNDSGVLAKLVELMDSHFAHEEREMKKAAFDGHDEHKDNHDEFLASLKKLKTPVAQESVQWAKNWLVHHIKVTDSKYSGKLHL
ncbi:hypothetical protein HELRODRAFT_111854 [Helobdella robusta]|uniref:Hemerythrin-like domain-containing protein n=1 Tax=Helobdella robusta TaxID=6412 RepID=T1EFF1_HELRO|nr:hypothetical protein HELRODRAFT_111854 [Helobdella robusta]ESO03916.1 hypothetical protein HELRODRAFT_111854 [Helobdella robusta]